MKADLVQQAPKRFPASYAQQSVWFSQLLSGNQPLYNIVWVLQMSGPLQVDVLVRSLQTIVDRHEVLRSCFTQESEGVMQIVLPERPINLIMEDFSKEQADNKQRLLAERKRQLALEPFDLQNGPLVQFYLQRFDEEEHVLLIRIHHILEDGASWSVFFDELTALLQGSHLPELQKQYSDYSIWQREMIENGSWRAHEEYWSKSAAGMPLTTLPYDHRNSSGGILDGAIYESSIDRKLIHLLLDRITQQRTSLFRILITGFFVLLHRLTGENEVAVGTTLMGRSRPEFDRLIGFFANPAFLRIDLQDDPTFLHALSKVSQELDRMVQFEDYPCTKILNKSNLSRDPGYGFFNRITFTKLQPPKERVIGSLVLRRDPFYVDVNLNDLSVYTQQTIDGLQLVCRYNRNLFEEVTIARIFRSYQVLLEGIANDPEERISRLSLLTSGDRHQILINWNPTPTNYPNICIHQLFEEQVKRTPEAIAVVFQGKQVTYRELNARSNRLAHCLRNRGAGPEIVVGIFIERSVEMVVAQLAVLKAGSAYLPLDPTYPKGRIQWMISESRIHLLLTQESLLEELPAFDGEALCVDRDQELWKQENSENLKTNIGPENLAYVIYTSGSTGRPKGVTIVHGSVVNYLVFLIKMAGVKPEDVVLQVSSMSFDPSVRDTIGPLIVGARVILVNSDDAWQPSCLLSKMKEHRVTCILSVVPTLLHELIQEAGEASYDSLRIILVSGEELHQETCRKAKNVFSSHVQIVNLYGPTECTMTSTYYPVGVSTDNEPDAVLIGKPNDNSQIYLLDRNLNPVPVGAPGEIHIGGPGVARGYLNHANLTAEKFIPDPFSPKPGARFYKTGDLARRLSDGNLEFLGRMDHQVKVHGYRIELGEIESVLNQHPEVVQGTVTAIDRDSGQKSLVAYFVPKGHVSPSDRDLRTFLKQQLPQYMIPSHFLMLKSLPTTQNGKVDRKALPIPEDISMGAKEGFVAPRTALEIAMASVWCGVLQVSRVGIHDDFFALGGDSLNATQVVSRIRQLFEVELPLKSIFEMPTLSELSAAVAQKQS